MMKVLDEKFGVFGRIVRGDYLECYIPKIEDSLRVTLIIKCFVKSLPADWKSQEEDAKKRIRIFKAHGIRLALGIGELVRLDLKKGIIDGEAIYFSGRKLSEEKTHDKKRVAVRQTLFFESFEEDLNQEVTTLLALVDELINRATAKQCQVLLHKLMGKDEQTISDELKRGQPTINQHSKQAGWHAIEQAVIYFENVISKKLESK